MANETVIKGSDINTSIITDISVESSNNNYKILVLAAKKEAERRAIIECIKQKIIILCFVGHHHLI